MCINQTCDCKLCNPLLKLICELCHDKQITNILIECDKCLCKFKDEIKRLRKLKNVADLCGDCKYKKIYNIVKDDSDITDIEDIIDDNISQRLSGFSDIFDDEF